MLSPRSHHGLQTHALRTSLALATVLAAGACSSSSSAAPDGGLVAVETKSELITSAGGTVALPSGAQVAIPAGALSEPKEITVSALMPQALAPVPGQLGATTSAPVAFTPHGQSFSMPVTLTLPFTAQGAGAPMVMRLDDERDTDWELVPNAAFQAAPGGGGLVATVQSTSFSIYVVIEQAGAVGDGGVDHGDGGPPSDAGPVPGDGGSGGGPDAGALQPDAGAPEDASVQPMDAGIDVDASIDVDSGPGFDSGPGVDSGPPDGGPPCMQSCTPGLVCFYDVCVEPCASFIDCMVVPGTVCQYGGCISATFDHDGDSVIAGQDCDDANASIFPGAVEICDPADVDEDCDPFTYGALDADADEYVSALCCNLDPSEPTLVCGSDCNDLDGNVGPGIAEICGDLIDNDCDRIVDNERLWWSDSDNDGFGDDLSASFLACDPGPGFAAQPGDCLDDDPSVVPGAVELCGDLIDNDCDNAVDQSDSDCP